MRYIRLFLLPAFITISVASISVISIYVLDIWKDLPVVDTRILLAPQQSLVIEDRNGQELFRFYKSEDRTSVAISKLNKNIRGAFIAIEDKRFATRGCIDWRAVVRAMIANTKNLKSQGASTITQQLVRTVYLSREKTLRRKVSEILLSCKIEKSLTKEQILEQYLNWISFGHNIAGIGQASRRFFGVEPEKLSIAQSAVLAALPQRPSYFSPYGSHFRSTVSLPGIPEEKKTGAVLPNLERMDIVQGLLPSRVRIGSKVQEIPGRANIVIALMKEQGMLSEAEAIQAEEDLRTLKIIPLRQKISAPHFIFSLKNELDQLNANEPRYGLEPGLTVRTTLDLPLQKIAEEVIGEKMQKMSEFYGAHNVSLLVVDRVTNEVLVYIGNKDFFDEIHGGQIDMIRTPRQTGSAFKPIVYAAYMEQGATSATPIYDNLTDTPYIPHQSGYYGKMTVRTALARSRNVPAVKAFYGAGGEDAVLTLASEMGIKNPAWYKRAQNNAGYNFSYSWTLAIGAAEASLMEMVQAYSVIGRLGSFTPLAAVRSIRSMSGSTLYVPDRKESQVLHISTAQDLESVLSDENAREPNWRSLMKLPYGPGALKTGTGTFCGERDLRGACKTLLRNNNWTIGFDDRLVVGVWIGNVDNAPIWEDSLLMATPIWKEFLIRAHSYHSPKAQ